MRKKEGNSNDIFPSFPSFSILSLFSFHNIIYQTKYNGKYFTTQSLNKCIFLPSKSASSGSKQTDTSGNSSFTTVTEAVGCKSSFSALIAVLAVC